MKKLKQLIKSPLKLQSISFTQLHIIQLAVATVVFGTAATHPSSDIIQWSVLVGLLVIPGWLWLQILKLNHRFALGERLITGLLLGIFTYMLGGLLINYALPLIGWNRPFAPLPALLGFSLITSVLWLLSFWRNRYENLEWRQPKISFNLVTTGIVFGLLPVLAASGAVTLNNNGPDAITVLLYLLIAALSFGLVVLRRYIPAQLYPWAIFSMSLALLWSTSIRGWHITGHDIQLEYLVLWYTSQAGNWAMSHFQDPYNACLSITILPTVLKSISGIDASWLYKAAMQVVYAASITSVYYIGRRFVAPSIAFLSALIFMTFPTIVIDMPFLIRQEIAFAFFSTLVMVLLNRTGFKTNRWLVAILALGLVVSHYSTTFASILLLGGVWAVSRIWYLIGRRWDNPADRRWQPVGFGIVAVLIIGTVIWTGVFTKTSSNVVRAFDTVRTYVANGFKLHTANDNSGYTIIKLPQMTDQQLLDLYMSEPSLEAKESIERAGGRLVGSQAVQLKALPEPASPLTIVGNWLKGLGITPAAMIFAGKQFYTFGLQMVMVVGCVAIFFVRKRLQIPTNFIWFVPVGLGLIVFQLLVPSVEYGILRMFQHVLYLGSLIIVLGTLEILSWYKLLKMHAQTILAGTVTILYLFVSGTIGAITGGVPATIQFANSGFYYDAYYTTGSDVQAFRWLRDNREFGLPLYTDAFTRMRFRTETTLVSIDSLAPSHVSTESYVLASGANVTSRRVALYYQGNLLFYELPTDYYSDHKDLIYSSNRNEIYR